MELNPCPKKNIQVFPFINPCNPVCSEGAVKKSKKRLKKVLLNCGKVVGLQPETAQAVEGKSVLGPCSLKVLEQRRGKEKSFSF
ncbi:MAG: hypothetical protein ACI815_001093, partial [Psychroserpens sp.]